MSENKSFRKTLRTVAVCCTLTAALSVSAFAANVTAVTSANVRVSADQNSAVLTTMNEGTTVKKLGISGNWTKVKVNGKTGYVYTEFLKTAKAAPAASQEKKTSSATVKATSRATSYVKALSTVNVRKSADNSAAVVTTFAEGTTAQKLGTSGNWTKVKVNGKTGYVYSKFVSGSGSSSSSSSSSSSGTKKTYVKATASVNIRKSASGTAQIIGSLKQGGTAQKLGTSGAWTKVKVGGVTGYISSKYLKASNGSSTIQAQTNSTGKKVYVKASTAVNVRKSASNSAAIITTLQQGATAEKLGTSGAWTKVKVNGKTGYVFSKYLTGGGSSSSSQSSQTTTLGIYTTTFATSQSARCNNLRLACKAINGTVIQPGYSFSFNGTVGERTAAKGYEEAYVIENGEYVMGLGGGVCQVSSTLFNAALRANMTITERHFHSISSSYVPAGADATVAYGSKNLRFVNPYKVPVTIYATYNSGGSMTMKLTAKGVSSPRDLSIQIIKNSAKNYTLKRYVGGSCNYATSSSYKTVTASKTSVNPNGMFYVAGD